MSEKPAVVIVAPNSFERVLGCSWENQFQLITKSGHLASLTNLDRIFNSDVRHAELDKGWKSTNPMAGYYLESFLKLKGYEARCVFDWETDSSLLSALQLDPIAVAFSTTYITDNRMLADCVRSLRPVIGGLPLIIGGPYIWKQKLERSRDSALNLEHATGMQAMGVDLLADCLFGPQSEPILRDAIYIAQEFGEYTLLKVLAALESGGRSHTRLQDVPNLVLPANDGEWYSTREEPEPVNLDTDYTRWDLVDSMPSLVPIRTSVGCPYRCRYCDFIELHPAVIKRSPRSMIQEIGLAKHRGKKFFNLIDDNIFLTKSRIDDLTRTIREHEIDMIWGGFFRVDRVDETNIAALSESGCRFGMCGIESADDGQLERMRKGCQQEEIFRGIELSTSAGIKLVLTLIVGYPGETQASIDTTVSFLNRLTTTNKGYSCFQVYPFYLLPNTAVDALEYRKLFDLRGRYASWSHNTMDSEEATHLWAPYLFKHIETLPYDYYATDCPFWWEHTRRSEAFRLRRVLTNAFLDGESDDTVQLHFSGLYRFLADGQRDDLPHWQEVLAERSHQPGRRMPRARLGG